MNPEIQSLIQQADQAIREERFDDLMEFYTEDAVLVINGKRRPMARKPSRKLSSRLPPISRTASSPHREKCG